MHSKFAFMMSMGIMFSAWLPVVENANILAVYTFPGKSHYMMHVALIKELIRKGHQITMITALTLRHQNLGSNYTEIFIDPVYDYWNDVVPYFKADNIFELTKMDLHDFLKMLEIIGLKTTEHALKQLKVQEIINARHTRGVYDLLLAEQFYQEPFLALSRIYDIPVITTSTLGYENHMSQMMGLIQPWSFVPHGFMPYTDRMSFTERLQNSYYSLFEDVHREWIYFPKMDKLVQTYFGHLEVPIPKISDMEKNISVMLLNSYAPLTTTRPTIAGMIPVGGMHIYPPRALPEDIQKFLDEANDGVIYFSLGSNVQSKDMPAEKMKIFLQVFGKMKQRILWKFEKESIPNKPDNIMIKSWLPQSDILAHENIKVFITHGGLLGIQEGVYHAVPMLGMPIYCDQHLNMKKAILSGYAINIHFQSITEEILKNSLEELLYNPAYRNNIKNISQIFKDRPLNARDMAIYWIEYVVRYRGAPHLRSAGLDLKWSACGDSDDVDLMAGHGYSPNQKYNSYSAFGPIGGAIVFSSLVIGLAVYYYRHSVDNSSQEQFYVDSMQEENYGLRLSRFSCHDCQPHDELSGGRDSGRFAGGRGGYDQANVQRNLLKAADISPHHISTGSSYKRPLRVDPITVIPQ